MQTKYIVSFGLLIGGLAVQVQRLPDWKSATKPAFVGVVLAQIGAVLAAVV